MLQVLQDHTLEPPNEGQYGKGAPWEAPELEAFKYTDQFVKLAKVAGEHGILIVIAAHRLNQKAWPGDGLWFDGSMTEARVKQSWSALAKKLCGSWNVLGVDLHNEPHAASWGKGDLHSDWGHGAERLGNHVLSVCPRWLILIEGVGFEPGAKDMDSGGAGIWWGENLYGAKEQPVKLSDPSKLVYSPHTYGPGTYVQRYFTDATFPNNMPKIWEKRFGFLAREHPLVIGEFGGFYTRQEGCDPTSGEGCMDKQWQDAAVKYMAGKGIGCFYFAMNPGSTDTGGLLLDDYTSVDEDKVWNTRSYRDASMQPTQELLTEDHAHAHR